MSARDGYHLAFIGGTVCRTHNRFHHECGCPPPTPKEQHVTSISEPVRIATVVRAATLDGEKRTLIRRGSPDAFDRWVDVRDDAGYTFAWTELINPEILFEGESAPTPEEPTSIGAVVRASYEDRGRLVFIRVDSDTLGWRESNGHEWVLWEDLTDVEVISEGVKL